jgi:hypothetical protein
MSSYQVQEWSDLLDGRVFEEIVAEVLNCHSIPNSDAYARPDQRILNAIEQLAKVIRWENMPEGLTRDEVINTSMEISDGNIDFSSLLLQFLRFVHLLPSKQHAAGNKTSPRESTSTARPTTTSDTHTVNTHSVPARALAPVPASIPAKLNSQQRQYYSNEDNMRELKSARKMALPVAASSEIVSDYKNSCFTYDNDLSIL